MLYLPWRNEQTDLYGQYDTYSHHLQAVQNELSVAIKQFEQFDAEVSHAQEVAETAHMEQQ